MGTRIPDTDLAELLRRWKVADADKTGEVRHQWPCGDMLWKYGGAIIEELIERRAEAEKRSPTIAEMRKRPDPAPLSGWPEPTGSIPVRLGEASQRPSTLTAVVDKGLELKRVGGMLATLLASSSGSAFHCFSCGGRQPYQGHGHEPTCLVVRTLAEARKLGLLKE